MLLKMSRRHLIKRSMTCSLTILIFTLYVSKFLLLKSNRIKKNQNSDIAQQSLNQRDIVKHLFFLNDHFK
jgi:hypothetical protein